jgi:ATP-dependent protease HslVU (ClpYQ) ATPase subunit
MTQMTPQEIVHELNKHIIGQDAAKRAVASCAIAGVASKWPSRCAAKSPPRTF